MQIFGKCIRYSKSHTHVGTRKVRALQMRSKKLCWQTIETIASNRLGHKSKKIKFLCGIEDELI